MSEYVGMLGRLFFFLIDFAGVWNSFEMVFVESTAASGLRHGGARRQLLKSCEAAAGSCDDLRVSRVFRTIGMLVKSILVGRSMVLKNVCAGWFS